MCLLGTAAYGLITSDDKWQHQSDTLFIKLGLHHIELIAQLFASLSENMDMMLLAMKTVYNILPTGTDGERRRFITMLNDACELGDVINGPGEKGYYGMNLIQYED